MRYSRTGLIIHNKIFLYLYGIFVTLSILDMENILSEIPFFSLPYITEIPLNKRCKTIRTNERTDRQADRQTSERTNGRTDRQM